MDWTNRNVMDLVNKTIHDLSELDDYHLSLKFNCPSKVYRHRIVEHLEKHEMTIADLSASTGISRQNLKSFIEYKTVPSFIFAIQIAKVFGLSVEEMFVVNDEIWYELAKIDTQTNKTLYLDCLTFQVITSKTKNELIKQDDPNLWVHLDTKERMLKSMLSEEQLCSDKWYPRFQQLIKKIEPIFFD